MHPRQNRTNSPTDNLGKPAQKSNSIDTAASFDFCANLQVAEGTFHGSVDFNASGVVKIGNLTITKPDNNGYAASFHGCLNLDVAEGAYPGFVEFGRAGIKRISNLTITDPDSVGNAAGFADCRKLEVAEGIFPGSVDFSNSGLKMIGSLDITAPNEDLQKANFTGCLDLRLPAKFLGSEYTMEEPARRENLSRIAAAKAVGATPDLEI